MQFKLENTDLDADIFIYGKMGPDETKQILLSKIELLKKHSTHSIIINKLQENHGKLWLVRDSRVDGLLTVQSLSYDITSSQWKSNEPQRYMLSVNKGWILNNNAPDSPRFNATASQSGGIIKMTEENATPHLPGLLKLLSEQGYDSENRVNPKIGEETTTQAYSHYTAALDSPQIGHSVKKSNSVSLPEGILMALSCPLTIQQTGEARLMKDPITLVSDGISYERDNVLAKYPDMLEGRDFYPNTKLKTIINYVAATSLQPEEYLAKLQKVDDDIMDPILLVAMENPVLSPSGISYEKSAIEQWIKTKQAASPILSGITPILDPVTKEDIRDRVLVENSNLREFIKAWPSFHEQQHEKWSTPHSHAFLG